MWVQDALYKGGKGLEMRVGFIGIGVMGEPMAANLVTAGFEVAVYDKRKEPLNRLQMLGARVSGSPKEAAISSDVMVIMVRDDLQTQEVVYGKEGILEGLDEGTIITMNTVSPTLVQRIAQEARSGVEVLDAAVSGGPMGAKAGTLTIMVGGKRQVLEKYLPILEAMGNRIIYCGSIGSGLVAKLTNQMMVQVISAGLLESLTLGRRAGLDLKVLLDVYRASTARSWVVEQWDWIDELRKNRKPGNILDLLYKDTALALDFAKSKKVSIPVTTLCRQLDLRKII